MWYPSSRPLSRRNTRRPPAAGRNKIAAKQPSEIRLAAARGARRGIYMTSHDSDTEWECTGDAKHYEYNFGFITIYLDWNLEVGTLGFVELLAGVQFYHRSYLILH